MEKQRIVSLYKIYNQIKRGMNRNLHIKGRFTQNDDSLKKTILKMRAKYDYNRKNRI